MTSTQASYSFFSLLQFHNQREGTTEVKYIIHHPGQVKWQDLQTLSRAILIIWANDTSSFVMLRPPLHFFVCLECCNNDSLFLSRTIFNCLLPTSHILHFFFIFFQSCFVLLLQPRDILKPMG